MSICFYCKRTQVKNLNLNSYLFIKCFSVIYQTSLFYVGWWVKQQNLDEFYPYFAYVLILFFCERLCFGKIKLLVYLMFVILLGYSAFFSSLLNIATSLNHFINFSANIIIKCIVACFWLI